MRILNENLSVITGGRDLPACVNKEASLAGLILTGVALIGQGYVDGNSMLTTKGDKGAGSLLMLTGTSVIITNMFNCLLQGELIDKDALRT